MSPADRARRAWDRIQTYEVWAAKAEVEVIETEISAAVAYERRVHSTLGAELVAMAGELGQAGAVNERLRDAIQRLLKSSSALETLQAQQHARYVLHTTRGK